MTLFEHYCACENCFCALFVIYLLFIVYCLCMSSEQTLSRLGLGNKQDDHSEHVDAHADAHDSAHADEDDDILYIVYIAWLLFVYVVTDDLQPNPKSQPFQKCCDVMMVLLSTVL